MDESPNPDDTLPDEFYMADTIAEIEALPDMTMVDFAVPHFRPDRVRRQPTGNEEE